MTIYTFKKYNQDFPKLFVAEKERLQAVIDLDCVIEHIGSTAVPDLGGKGVIDLMVAADAASQKTLFSLLIKAGYEKLEQGSMIGRSFFVLDKEDYRYHLHLVERDSDYFKEAIFFRDYLRGNDVARTDYENFKREVLQAGNLDHIKYREIKNPYIRTILNQHMI